MRLHPRPILLALLITGLAGAALCVPAVSLIGSLLLPSQPAPATTRVRPLLADAIWARTNGGGATALLPLNPFTIARTASCHLLAERFEPSERKGQHDECMKLLPGVEAVGYLSSVHMRSEGVWQDPRVPFVQIATMNRIMSTWTKAELLDTLAARGEFGLGFVGIEAAASGYFGRSVDQLTLPQVALLGSFVGDTRTIDPWCDPEEAAGRRHRILERMRENDAIDETAFNAADRSELALGPPPADHKPCAS